MFLGIIKIFFNKKQKSLDKSQNNVYNSFCICGCSSSGRAPPCQGGGSEFEPRHPLHIRAGSSVG